MNQNPPPFPHPFHYDRSADRAPAAGGVSYSAVGLVALPIHPSQVPRLSPSTSLSSEPPNPYASPRAHPQRRSPVPPPAFPLAPPPPNAGVPVTQAPMTHSRIPPSPTWHYPTIPSQNMDPRAALPVDRANSTSGFYPDTPSAPRTTRNGIGSHRNDNYNNEQQYASAPRDDGSRDKGPPRLPFAVGRARQVPPPLAMQVGSCRLRSCQAPTRRSELEHWNGFCKDQHMWDAINAGEVSRCQTCLWRACRVGSRFCSEACRR